MLYEQSGVGVLLLVHECVSVLEMRQRGEEGREEIDCCSNNDICFVNCAIKLNGFNMKSELCSRLKKQQEEEDAKVRFWSCSCESTQHNSYV